jgi:hypothetical protein
MQDEGFFMPSSGIRAGPRLRLPNPAFNYRNKTKARLSAGEEYGRRRSDVR